MTDSTLPPAWKLGQDYHHYLDGWDSSAVDAVDLSPPFKDIRHPLVVEIEQLRERLAASENRADHLETGMTSAREIGAAIGVLMATHHVTYDQGFDLLRASSQSAHRKLRDIAGDVLFSGALPDDKTRRLEPAD